MTRATEVLKLYEELFFNKIGAINASEIAKGFTKKAAEAGIPVREVSAALTLDRGIFVRFKNDKGEAVLRFYINDGSPVVDAVAFGSTDTAEVDLSGTNVGIILDRMVPDVLNLKWMQPSLLKDLLVGTAS